jgi:hypothetical protein
MRKMSPLSVTDGPANRGDVYRLRAARTYTAPRGLWRKTVMAALLFEAGEGEAGPNISATP